MQELGPDDPRYIGNYTLLRRLGAGGMGRVYLGRTAGGRTVAVKQVHSAFAADQEFRTRFRLEVAAARRVGGRWTAPVLDADTEGPAPWVATGYVAGPSLHEAVHGFGPLPPASVRALGAGLAEALAAVHALGLVHRDVKPSNVLLALDGPRLIDFGISRALDAASPLTRTGFLIGSPGYLSPEQAQGAAAGPASDVFSLGAVLAFAATGSAPFGENVAPATLLYRVLHEDPDLRAIDPDLREVIAACLAKNPAARPTTDQLRTRLDGPGGAAARLGSDGWLPPAVAGAVGRVAVELLDLDTEPGHRPVQDGSLGPTQQLTPPPVTQYSNQPPAPPYPHHPGPPAPAAPATMAAAQGGQAQWPQPGWPQTTPVPAAKPRSKGPLIAVGAVAIAAIAGAGIYAASASSSKNGAQNGPNTSGKTALGNQQGNQQGATTAPDQPATHTTTSPAAPTGAIPDAYLGTWDGAISGVLSGGVPLDYQIAVGQGKLGQKVAHIHNDGGGGTYCDGDAALISVDSDQIVLKTIPNSVSAGCVPISDPQYYTLQSDGSLQVSVAGMDGILERK